MQTDTRALLIEALEDGVAALTAALDEARVAVNGHDAHEILSHVTNAHGDVVDAQDFAVTLWHSYGASWTDVGNFYGTSRQNAWERFGKRASA